MATLDPAVFQTDLVRQDWIRLTKLQLLQVAEFQEIEVSGNVMKNLNNWLSSFKSLVSVAQKQWIVGLAELERKTQIELAKIKKQGKLERVQPRGFGYFFFSF